tara:strand:+ start:966 stop:1430 length:465 start_codon:yes stop_codon:yes gene_type:complete
MAKEFEMKLTGNWDFLAEIIDELETKEKANTLRAINRKILKDTILSDFKSAAPSTGIAKATKIMSGKKDKTAVVIGIEKNVDTYQAGWLEYGTEQRENESGANRGAITPKPFFRPVWDSGKDKVLKAVENDYGIYMQQILDKKVKANAKKIEKL